MRTSTRVAGVVAGLTLTLGSLGTMSAATAAPHDAKPAACAQQQTQVDHAEDALARVTAVFERQKDKVQKAKHRAAAADTAQERNAARKALRKAKHTRDEAKKDKVAQQQRLARAQGRLADCKAAHAG